MPATVVVITVDSLRADAQHAMPTLQRLADGGTRFTHAYTHGNWTPFSFPSVLGSDPVFTDGPRVGPSARETVAERLQRAGVETVGLNAANGFLTEHWGYDRGFDTFETFLGGSRWLAAHPTVGGWLQLVAAPGRRAMARIRGTEDRIAVDTSHLKALEDHATAAVESADGPLFCWLHYMDTHTPYLPAPRHVRAVTGGTGSGTMLRAHVRAGLGREVSDQALDDLRALYHGAAHQVDASIARVLATLREAGRGDATVVVAGDHGEEFQEHGHLAHYPKLYRELVHVPLVVGRPADVESSENEDAAADASEREDRVATAPVGLDVIPPTVCDAFDLPTGDLAGRSLLPTVRDGQQVGGDPVVSVAVRGPSVTTQPIPRRLDDGELLVSVRDERFTYISHTESGAVELYDRSSDPGEQTDVAGEARFSTVESAFEDVAAAHAASLGGDGADAHGEEEGGVPEDVSERLRALGYR
ncbi:sulfatase [Halomarina salina]|uniref:Sulfatase n=1 Tax=Halomarina salina TaxID=1872699 RepID=A0ABD5RHJ1_9EURY